MHFRTGLACPELPSSWPVQTWLVHRLVHRILARFAWVSDRDSTHKAHRLGQSKRGCCFLLCVISLLDSSGCQIVTLHIILASPNMVAASSCDSYTCSIGWVSDCNSTRTRRIVLASPNISLTLWRVPAVAISVFPRFLILGAVYILSSTCRYVIWPTCPPDTPYNNDTAS